MTKKDAINWFEIYAADFGRAKGFYEAILKTSLEETACGGENPMALFPWDATAGVGGCLTQMDCAKPGPGGTLVYLNVEGDLDGVLERVPTAGGEVVKSRTAIGEHGFFGIIKDSEDNIVGLHSLK